MLSAGRRLASYDSIEGLSVRFRADKWEMAEGGLLPSLSLRVLASRLADMPRESPRQAQTDAKARHPACERNQIAEAFPCQNPIILA